MDGLEPHGVAQLAAGFPAPSGAEWRRAVEAMLKGRGVDELTLRDPDGLAIAPLYPPATDGQILARAPRDDEAAWDIRELVDAPDAAEANRRALDGLNGGAGSVLLVLRDGNMRVPDLLDGVVLEIAGAALDAGFLGPLAAEGLATAAKGSPRARLALHLDPLSAFARAGVSPGPIAAHLARAGETAARHAPVYPQASLFLASGRAVHEAGGTDAQELAFALAAALAYARALVATGLSMEAAFGGIVLGLSLEAAPLSGVAKLRAARLLWARLTDACGIAVPARIEARSSRRMLAVRAPWTNLLRLSCAAFAGAVGGADALVIEPFSAAAGEPDERARCLARNTQLILMDESGLGHVADPAAGSGYLEAHARGLARAAWDLFREVERAGGIAAALQSGQIADQAAAARAEREAAFAAGAAPILGVTLHPGELEAAAPAPSTPSSLPEPAALPGPDDRCPALVPMRWAEPFEAKFDEVGS